MIQAGDIVRVWVPSKFQGQEVKVLDVHYRPARSKTQKSYLLATKLNDLSYPAWFEENEIELVETQEKDT